MHCGLLGGEFSGLCEFSELFVLKFGLHVLFILWFVLAHALAVSMHCGSLGGEFSEIFYFLNWIPMHTLFILWFVFFHRLLLIWMQCGLLEGEFSEMCSFKPMSCSFYGFSSPCSIAYFNALWITIQQVSSENCSLLKQVPCLIHFVVCLGHALAFPITLWIARW